MKILNPNYSYNSRNYSKDFIYYNRLRLIEKLNIDVNKNPKIYGYYMDAYLGITLI